MRKTYWTTPSARHANPAFSMSFLDLLADTLGALIFILILLLLVVPKSSQEQAPAPGPPPEDPAEVHRRVTELRKTVRVERENEARLREALLLDPRQQAEALAASREKAEAARREAEQEIEDLRRRVQEAKDVQDRLRRDIDRASRDLDLVKQAAASGKKVAVPTGTGSNPAAAKFTDMWHVICDKEGLVITHQPRDGKPKMNGVRVKRDQIKGTGRFQEAIREVKDHPGAHTMILWVKPSGIGTYDELVMPLVLEAVINYGDEPADEDLELHVSGD